MTVIARDAVARDHLVYAWPLPIGPECEVSCGDDEQVVMCPAWTVGERLGPGRHHWRTPDPMRPVSAFFVSTHPVDVTFDMTTQFMIPTTGQPVRVRATGSLQVRCADPALLIAQFVGLPFDSVNDGVLRSVTRSVERMLARLLTRRVVMAATPAVVTDPTMLSHIVEELIAYNPTAGAVFGIELMGVHQVVIGADDGSTPFVMLNQDWGQPVVPVDGTPPPSDAVPVAMTPTNGHGRTDQQTQPLPLVASASGEIDRSAPQEVSGEINLKKTQRHASVPPISAASSSPKIEVARDPRDSMVSSGEIDTSARSSARLHARPSTGDPVVEEEQTTQDTPAAAVAPPPTPPAPPARPTPAPRRIPSVPPPIPPARVSRPIATPPVEVPRSPDEITQPGVHTPLPGALRAPDAARSSSPSIPAANTRPEASILGIGMSPIGSAPVPSPDMPSKIAPGNRVLVPGPDGLMQSATVRQLLQGYYELEVGSSGETIWVPATGVVPE